MRFLVILLFLDIWILGCDNFDNATCSKDDTVHYD